MTSVSSSGVFAKMSVPSSAKKLSSRNRKRDDKGDDKGDDTGDDTGDDANSRDRSWRCCRGCRSNGARLKVIAGVRRGVLVGDVKGETNGEAEGGAQSVSNNSVWSA
ncbi:hypothetical protein OAM67_00645 [bacterium]|nr:hypothetical protein [bacterium]